jgi:multidrug efflux pump subunit AcrA (membrane-fusion protein)
MTKPKRVRLIAAGAAVLLVVIFFWWRAHRSAAAPAAQDVIVSVQVAKAERGLITNEIAMIASLVPQTEATISPKVSAQIARMQLLTNRVVNAGDVIAVLESRDLAAQRGEAAAAVAEMQTSMHSTAKGAVPLTNAQDSKATRDAQAALDNARRIYDRRQTLFEQGGIAKKDLEASHLELVRAQDDLALAEANATLHRGVTNPSDIRTAEARAAQARHRLGTLDAQLGYTVIRAPFHGVITQQFQYQGDFAVPGGRLVTIADPANLIAKMQIAEHTAAQIKVGDAVRILPDDLSGQTFPGTVSLVGKGADPQSRSVEVWVRVPNARGLLRPNGVARVIIDAQPTSNAIVLPESAITLDATNGNSGTVMVVDAKSIVHEVHVTSGIRSAGRVQITSGLNGGETVVTQGNYGLPDGTQVAIAQQNAEETDRGASGGPWSWSSFCSPSAESSRRRGCRCRCSRRPTFRESSSSSTTVKFPPIRRWSRSRGPSRKR